MSEEENVIVGEVISEENSSEWFISAIKGNSEYLKSNYNIFAGTKGEGGRTALMYLADSGNLDCIKFFVSHGEELQKQDDFGNTALMYAAKKGFLDCVEQLVDSENNIINKENKRAVNFAIENKHFECAGFLEMYEFLDYDESSTDDNKDDSNSERNLIKENKRLKKQEQVLKKVNKDMDKVVGIEENISK